MQTGENEQALRQITDMSRLIAIVLLVIHFYYYCYGVFHDWGINIVFTDRLLGNIERTGLFKNVYISKSWSLCFLLISLMGARGKKKEKLNHKTCLFYLFCGLLIFFVSVYLLNLKWTALIVTVTYIAASLSGFLLIISGGTLLTRIIKGKLNEDIFNAESETFPQEERLLENEYSINLKAHYNLKGKWRSSYINWRNIFRGILILGNPGSGKSLFLVRQILTQSSAKGYAQLVYDFKFPDLSLIAYNHFLKNKRKYKGKPSFHVITLDDPKISSRSNPLAPSMMTDITDAMEAARTILLNLNREWIKKQGEFFQESAINFVSAIIWYLRCFKKGIFCTLPHAIEFLSLDYNSLFTLLRTEPSISTLISPFLSAYLNDVLEQLEGQIASAKIALGRLSSPSLYYVLSGNDFSLDINNPNEPKIICLGNNPLKIQTYGAVLALYVNRILKLVNRRGMLKNVLVFDEFPTIYLGSGTISNHIAVARGYKSATVLACQDMSQLRKDYGKDEADIIFNIVGNVISGQVSGDTAKQLSERIGRIMQDRTSLSINSGDTSISKSKQLEAAVPPSRIASLSSGEFVGLVADDPDCPIQLKAFHNQVLTDISAVQAEEKSYKQIESIREDNKEVIQQTFDQIKKDIEDLKHSELQRMLSDPSLAHLIIRK
jgi:hypothetical protein